MRWRSPKALLQSKILSAPAAAARVFPARAGRKAGAPARRLRATCGAIVARTMAYRHVIGGEQHVFADLRTLLAKATPPRSGD